jgi:hypothetical protein
MTAYRQHLSTAAAHLRELAALGKTLDAPQNVIDDVKAGALVVGSAYREIALLCEAYYSEEARHSEHEQRTPEQPRPHGSRRP